MVTPLMAQFAYGTKWNISRLRLQSRRSDVSEEDVSDAIPRGPTQQADALPDDGPVMESVWVITKKSMSVCQRQSARQLLSVAYYTRGIDDHRSVGATTSRRETSTDMLLWKFPMGGD